MPGSADDGGPAPGGEDLVGVVELPIGSAEHRRADLGYVLAR